MDLGSILFGLALLILLAAFVGRPLLNSADVSFVGAPDRKLSRLLAERDRILNTLQELDMDYAVNKLDERDYRIQRSALVQRGAQVLREIDQLSELPPTIEPAQVNDLEAQIESEILRLRHDSERASDPAGYCPACGSAAQAGDKFCTHCGETLAPQEQRT